MLKDDFPHSYLRDGRWQKVPDNRPELWWRDVPRESRWRFTPRDMVVVGQDLYLAYNFGEWGGGTWRVRLDTGQWHYQHWRGASWPSMDQLVVDGAGRVWAVACSSTLLCPGTKIIEVRADQLEPLDKNGQVDSIVFRGRILFSPEDASEPPAATHEAEASPPGESNLCTPQRISFDSSGQFIAVSRGPVLCRFDGKAWRVSMRSPYGPTEAFALKVHGETAILALADNGLMFWNLRTGRARFASALPPRPVSGPLLPFGSGLVPIASSEPGLGTRWVRP